jgi:aminoglycoside phosphotransferase (APT) family kinase protein
VTELPKGINEPAVSAWLLAHIAGAEGPFSYTLIAGGHSNLTYRVVGSNNASYVLRRPPLGHVLATAHDMVREHKIISAVGKTTVPVPSALGLCSDTAVNDAPFYVMGYVDGTVLDNPDKAVDLSADTKRALSWHLVDVLADLHEVDIDAVGLGDLAKREGYIPRQLKRWITQWENSKTRELPIIDELAARLAGDIPVQQGVSIAHGDYRFGNCLVDLPAGRIAAVLDWELCTLGDPLADLGYIGVYWSGADGRFGRANDPTGAGGFPTHRDLVERYATRTGRDVSHIGYYVAFSAFRLAVISEGVHARYLHGVMGNQVSDEQTRSFEGAVQQLTEAALDALGAR